MSTEMVPCWKSRRGAAALKCAVSFAVVLTVTGVILAAVPEFLYSADEEALPQDVRDGVPPLDDDTQYVMGEVSRAAVLMESLCLSAAPECVAGVCHCDGWLLDDPDMVDSPVEGGVTPYPTQVCADGVLNHTRIDSGMFYGSDLLSMSLAEMRVEDRMAHVKKLGIPCSSGEVGTDSGGWNGWTYAPRSQTISGGRFFLLCGSASPECFLRGVEVCYCGDDVYTEVGGGDLSMEKVSEIRREGNRDKIFCRCNLEVDAEYNCPCPGPTTVFES